MVDGLSERKYRVNATIHTPGIPHRPLGKHIYDDRTIVLSMVWVHLSIKTTTASSTTTTTVQYFVVVTSSNKSTLQRKGHEREDPCFRRHHNKHENTVIAVRIVDIFYFLFSPFFCVASVLRTCVQNNGRCAYEQIHARCELMIAWRVCTNLGSRAPVEAAASLRCLSSLSNSSCFSVLSSSSSSPFSHCFSRSSRFIFDRPHETWRQTQQQQHRPKASDERNMRHDK